MPVFDRVEPLRKINPYTVIIPLGREDGLEHGEKIVVTLGKGDEPAKVIDVGRKESVAELVNA
ncbi:MAG: hypothetical protein ABEH81_04670 [Halopenitus sp.]